MRKAGSARKQAGDVRRARETIESIQAELEDLKISFDDEVAALDSAYDAQTERLTETQIKPKSTEIEIAYFGIGWIPN
jgi:phage host-nuclease inhibitor protein Gam